MIIVFGKLKHGARLVVQGGQNGGMEKAHDFVALTRMIEPAGGPDLELVTLADAAKFVGPCGLAPSVPSPAAGLG